MGRKDGKEETKKIRRARDWKRDRAGRRRRGKIGRVDTEGWKGRERKTIKMK